MILVDTSVWIDYFNGYASLEMECLTQLILKNECIILSGLVLTEILMGLKTPSTIDKLSNLLTAFSLAPEYDLQDYKAAAQIYRICRQKGQTIRSTIDCLIAQSCLKHNYALLSKDNDFKIIAQYTSLNLFNSYH